MSVKVCKFGGTSLADAAQQRKIKAIVDVDSGRRFVVPSAPGKRSKDDQKITDLLYLCHAHAQQHMPFEDVFDLIAQRYLQIVADLDLSLDLDQHLYKVKADIAAGASEAYAASRGEYLNGPIIAALLDYTFIDAAEVIHFGNRGRVDMAKTKKAMAERLKGVERAVIPGFYGVDPQGEIKTFSRGGSDVTGAVVSACVKADVYENWTDVSGMRMTDPRVVDDPKPIETITYRELRELAYMGATVLHDEAIFPVREAKIPVNIRNTNDPDDPGTMIVPNEAPLKRGGLITGIAGRKDFTVLALEKALMNSEVGWGRRMLSVLENHQVSFEHLPSGIDTMSVVIESKLLEGKIDDVVEAINSECKPDTIAVLPNMALIATVGRGMAHTPGMAARMFTALASAGVNIRMIDQGSSEINIIVGVENADFETAVRAIYNAFC